MSLIIALILVSSAIVIMFSQEFSNGFKWIFAIPGMALFLPLFVISYALLANQEFVFWLTSEAKTLLHKGITLLQACLPFQKGQYLLATASLISIVALMPHALIAYRKARRIHNTFHYAWFVSIVSWLILVILLVCG